MGTALLRGLRRSAERGVEAVRAAFREATRPGPVTGVVGDLFRSRRQLLAENALLRQQLVVAKRTVNKPKARRHERTVMVLLASVLEHGSSALLIVKPPRCCGGIGTDSRLPWRRRSRVRRSKPRIAPATVELIQRLATGNLLRGAERIRGELSKLGIRVCKRAVQKTHQGIDRLVPQGASTAALGDGDVIALPVVGGPHHDHRRAA